MKRLYLGVYVNVVQLFVFDDFGNLFPMTSDMIDAVCEFENYYSEVENGC